MSRNIRMAPRTVEIVYTDHARERMDQRRITPAMVSAAVTSPDRSHLEDDGDTKFIKTINGRKLHVVANYQTDEGKWLIISTFVRGENDALPLWRRLFNAIARFFFRK